MKRPRRPKSSPTPISFPPTGLEPDQHLAEDPPPQQAEPQDQSDLGFGDQISLRTKRLINKDGSFNVRRVGGGLRDIHPYQFLIAINWWQFWALVAAVYVLVNASFAGLYVLIGVEQLSGLESTAQQSWLRQFAEAFFFSVQTFTSVGYGATSPVGLGANLVSSFEAMVGLLGFALATGALFGRFARPSAKLAFSPQVVIAPHQGGRGLMFRLVNRRQNQLINLQVQVTLTYYAEVGGQWKRQFFRLPLERHQVTLFPLSWTVVHPIDADSPLYQCSQQWLRQHRAELLVVLQAYDDTFAQEVHTRTSYRYDEWLWGARFRPMFSTAEDGVVEIRVDEIGRCERAELPTEAEPSSES